MQSFTQAVVVSDLDGTDLPAAAAALAADPEIGRRDVFHAACAGDVDALREFLAADPDLVRQSGGHFEGRSRSRGAGGTAPRAIETCSRHRPGAIDGGDLRPVGEGLVGDLAGSAVAGDRLTRLDTPPGGR